MKHVFLKSLLRAAAGLALLALLAPPASVPAAEDEFMTPGPREMSEEERALEADPATGAEHGVILKVEFRDKEDDPSEMRVGMHMRAKILSAEGRDLGNIEIPYDAGRWKLKQWWGRVIKPDGEVLELPRESLEEHTLARRRGRDIVIRKAALPGIEPGVVIDYGYTLQQDNARYVEPWWRMRLQWSWPVKELRYTWTPYEYLPSGFVTTRAKGLDVTAERDFKHVRVVGRNLTPAKREPFMPPEDSVRAAVWFFYFGRDEEYKDFWNDKAKLVDERASEFMDDRRGAKAFMEELALDKGGSLEESLRAAYDWIVANIAVRDEGFDESIRSLRTDWRPKETKRVGEIVSGREGADVHRLLLMMGAARELGAEAHIVLAVDRTDHQWNKGVWTMSQFDEALVEVHKPGQALEEAILLAPHLDLPFGVVPYWVTESEALVATSEGAGKITPPSLPPEESLSDSRAAITFEMEGEPAMVTWSRTGTGQHAVQQESALHQATGEARARKIEQMCGKSSRFELADYAADEAASPGEATRVRCEGSLPEVVAEPEMERVSVSIQGPWIEPYPQFTARTRTHPLVFDYPCTDRAVIEVASPPGYAPVEPPEPVEIKNPFGTYSLKVEATEGGYRVERELRLPHQHLRARSLAGLRFFFQKVQKADSTSLVFKSSEGASL